MSSRLAIPFEFQMPEFLSLLERVIETKEVHFSQVSCCLLTLYLLFLQIEAADVGTIKRIHIRHDDTGMGAGWYLEKVNLFT